MTADPATAVADPPSSRPAAPRKACPRERSEGYLYLAMGLAVTAIVAFGFGQTVETKLIHPASPRPAILYLHVAVATAWVLLFITQSALVRVGRSAWHRRLGVAGAGLGALIPVVGVATALAMQRLHRAEGADHAASIIIPLYDMSAFSVMFALAIAWRRRPDYHRRAMLIATCGLTVAAFARFPEWLVPGHSWYAFVDALILVAALRDRIVSRQVHPLYLWALPLLAAAQTATLWLALSAPRPWVAIAHALLK